MSPKAVFALLGLSVVANLALGAALLLRDSPDQAAPSARQAGAERTSGAERVEPRPLTETSPEAKTDEVAQAEPASAELSRLRAELAEQVRLNTELRTQLKAVEAAAKVTPAADSDPTQKLVLDLIGKLSGMEEALKDGADTKSLEAIQAEIMPSMLQFMSQGEQAEAVLLDLLDDPTLSEQDRLAALELLSMTNRMTRRPAEQQAGRIERLLELARAERSPRVLAKLIRQLSSERDLAKHPTAEQLLLKHATSTDHDVREAAIEALGQLGTPGSQAALLKSAQDEGERMTLRQSALSTLQERTPGATTAVIGFSRHAELGLRLTAYYTLASFESETSLARLHEALNDERDPDCREAVHDAVLQRSSASSIPVLEALANDTGQDVTVRAAAQQTLGKLKQKLQR